MCIRQGLVGTTSVGVNDMDELRFPIGEFRVPKLAGDADRARWIDEIEQAPDHLRNAVDALNEEQQDTPYRAEGWTLRQVVHHLPDSHINAYVRMKLALTEDAPTVRGYFEERWAELPDGRTAPVEFSLALLEALHRRWVGLLRTLTGTDLERAFRRPVLGPITLDTNLAFYAWHGLHHVAHIASLRDRMDWA